MLVLGIDVGTQGARVLASDRVGQVVASVEEPFDSYFTTGLPDRWVEQAPQMWWQAVRAAILHLMQELRRQNTAATIETLSITSTSGTVVMVDGSGRPLRPALMYNDGRAQEEALQVQHAGQQLAAALGYRFNPSFALSKILWLRLNEPALFDSAHRFIHAADYVVGCLSGEYGISDFSNALKTGYDLHRNCWPDFIEKDLGIPLAKLPQVVPPSTPITTVSQKVAEETGLPADIPIMTGMTDGCASQISTGAVAPGDWCSTLGTTLVVKGVTRALLLDPQGRIYSHKHQDGYWLPGGASNTGGEALAQRFPREEWEAYNNQALSLSPTDVIVYPLARRGERFPFACPSAEGFVSGDTNNRAVSYAAHLEGVAYLERLAYDMLSDLGAEVGDTIFSAGGATHSRPWTQIRADVLGRILVRPEATGGAMGAAILAAAGTWYDGIIPAARAMVHIVDSVSPRPGLAAAFADRYQRFRLECAHRGYIEQ